MPAPSTEPTNAAPESSPQSDAPLKDQFDRAMADFRPLVERALCDAVADACQRAPSWDSGSFAAHWIGSAPDSAAANDDLESGDTTAPTSISPSVPFARCPERLTAAIEYALLAPGKRLRPALVLMAAEACGGDIKDGLPGAVAVEMIHAYSLIHDDLPAMDDDDLRRGRATVHIEFDEATAILAGDALQPMAFAHLCRQISNPSRLATAVELLAFAAGPANLVGGQADDLAAERESAEQERSERDCSEQNSAARRDEAGPDLAEHPQTVPRTDGTSEELDRRLEKLQAIHRRKTGALFSASLQLGAVLVGADASMRQSLANYASDIGLAFQVVDDLLDYTADEHELGKRVQKDAGRGKLTYPAIMGIDGARRRAGELIESAKGHVSVFGDAAWRLNTLADYVLARTH
ncbi:polyprenyl synthetase family protein [Roseiconus lacunae]|uniref:Polyprenyl synthetase family protein n=1 Tax=Roseiconus lacunae TaxID=2605694 RepID=A0ABT7PC30_9BACT|nr:polyprenyl synthetase family protein [Roseiconus lacunae]MDM4014001.1 polyprenyl synthetase family protein [Roseiconus lacunae]